MAKEFKLPPLGENVQSGTVVGVLVSEGDTIEVDQPVLEIETDKANLEVPSGVSGVVKEILVKSGDQAKVGQAILVVDENGAAGARQESVSEVEIQETVKPEPTIETKAPEEEAEKPEEKPAPEPAAPPPPVPEPVRHEIAPAAPSVRRFAREIGIDINRVPGSGPGGRISEEDVKAYVKQLNKARQTAMPVAGGVLPAVSLPDFSRWGAVEREPMTNLRRAASENLSRAWATIPHVTYADKADITELERLRKQYGQRVADAGGKLTMTAIALKMTVGALRRFPKFNASLDTAHNEIVYKKYYHIGVAVDTDRGLVVPVIRDVDKKNLIELSVELNDIAEKARNKKLSLDDMQGSSFTITNLGGFGGEYFTPIINAPDVAILGLARSRMEPVYIDGAFQPRLMLPLMISYDHRLIDGADGARFLKWLIEAFEQPFLLSLEG